MKYLKYAKLMAKMNARTQIPQPPVPQFEKYCEMFINDEEYDVLMGMKPSHNSEEELKAFYHGSDWDSFLYGLCRKGLLEKHYPKDEPAFYDLAPMLPGWFEFPLSTGEDTQEARKASELFTSAIGMVTTMNVEPMRTGYAALNNLNKLKGDVGHIDVARPLAGPGSTAKTVTVNKELSSDTASIYPSYQLKAFLESLPEDEPISLMQCFCRYVRSREGLPEKTTDPKEVCICVGDIAHQIIEFGVGHAIDKNEAIKILMDCEKKGCIHQVFHYGCNMKNATTAICNCDTQCCEMLGSYTRGGMQPLYLRSHAKPVITHPENCTGCNICNRYCPTVATGFDASKGKVFVEYQRCIGCGVCVTKCPQNVREMVDAERTLFCKPLPKNLVRQPNLKRQPKRK